MNKLKLLGYSLALAFCAGARGMDWEQQYQQWMEGKFEPEEQEAFSWINEESAGFNFKINESNDFKERLVRDQDHCKMVGLVKFNGEIYLKYLCTRLNRHASVSFGPI